MTTTEGNAATKDVNQREYIQYAISMDQAITQLVDDLHNSDDPEEILQEMLVAVTEFYDGDWAGIMEADLTMKIWSTYWWYNRKTGGMTPNRFGDLEEGEYLWRWIEAMTQGTPMIIEDVENLKEISPVEYVFLKENNVTSMIAVPFWKRPTGFLIVRNPKRYLKRTSVLKALAFVAVSSINEKRLMDSTKLSLTPDVIKKDTDIVINLLGDLKIITSKGVLTEEDIKSPRMCRMLVYLLLHPKRAASPYTISNAIWPDEDPENAGKNMKSLVYRFQQCFGLISDYRLIDSSLPGYRINPELNIITDLQIFDQYWQEGQKSTSLSAKGSLMKKALEIYTNGVLPAYADEHWLIPTVAHYSLRYIGVLNELLSTLDMAHDYVCIHEYANIAVKAVPGSVDAYYWLIYAMNHLGTTEIAKNELRVAKQILTSEEYNELLFRLGVDRTNSHNAITDKNSTAVKSSLG